jgi:hypothetical protein
VQHLIVLLQMLQVYFQIELFVLVVLYELRAANQDMATSRLACHRRSAFDADAGFGVSEESDSQPLDRFP